MAISAACVSAQTTTGDGGEDAPHAPASRFEAPRTIPVTPALAAIEVDGHLTEPAWTRAEVIPLPFEITPGDNTEARFRTDCHVTFDEEHLYLGCTAFDPDPESIRGYITDRDRIFGNHDRISFLVDPFNDTRRGWVFEISALGVQADLVYEERTGNFDASWDAIWSSAARVTGEGYVVEAAIPFRSLRFPGTSEPQAWRFWINRMRPRSDFVTMRSNTRLRDESCELCQAHVLEGLQGMDPGRNVELVPTLTATRADSRAQTFPTGPMREGTPEWEPGFDARWSVTTDLTLNGTVNPDFSQVEADVPQLGANQRFALFFPERRPFFLEGAELFRTPLQAVFTRTVADPVAGTKFTGKTGAHAIGVLVARDRTNNLILPGPFGSTPVSGEEEVTSATLRYRRDVGESNTLGALVTTRIGSEGYENHVGGIDAFFSPTSSLSLNVQLLASRTEYGTGLVQQIGDADPTPAGNAAVADLSFNTGDWSAFAGVNLRETGFRADAGFVPQVDTRSLWGNLARTFFGDEEDFFTRLSLRGGFWSDRTTGGKLIGEGLWTQVDFQGPLQSNGWINPFRSREFFNGREFDLWAVNVGVGLRPASNFRLALNGTFGDAVDFRNTRAAQSTRLNPSIELQLGRHVELEANHRFQRLTTRGAEILTENAGQLRAIYNFGPRSFVRTTVQYRRTSRDPETNPGLARPLEEGLFSQVLFSYKVNPLTVVFLGITDDRSGFEDATERIGLTPRSRTFFLKVGYAWRP